MLYTTTPTHHTHLPCGCHVRFAPGWVERQARCPVALALRDAWMTCKRVGDEGAAERLAWRQHFHRRPRVRRRVTQEQYGD
jgi:hypothetical protein